MVKPKIGLAYRYKIQDIEKKLFQKQNLQQSYIYIYIID